jgi:hypothetical protein
MCEIDGCDGEPVAKGLCAKHYMRLRRAGDPSRVRKPGPKRSLMRSVLPAEWSPRAQARFAQAMRMLEDAGGGAEKQQAVKTASRPNGSVNVSKLLRIAVLQFARFG